MARNRFFVENIAEEVLLTGDEFRHAKGVLRLTVGDEVTLLDGSGMEYNGIVSRSEKNALAVHVLSAIRSDREAETDGYLLIGALKGDKTELVVQKATELGVNRIGVFSSRYSSVSLTDVKIGRLCRVAREAAKQCMRATVPEVDYFPDFKSALLSAEGYKNKYMACEFLSPGTGEITDMGTSFALVVGSEGGFCQQEYDLALSMGFRGVSLGKRILRAETAAISFLSVAMYLAGELK